MQDLAPPPVAPGPPAAPGFLTPRRKAAIVVRLLLNEGVSIPLAELPRDMQAALTSEMGDMRYIDADTLHAVVREFSGELDRIGLTFPQGVSGALSMLESHLSPETAAELKAGRSSGAPPDPWVRLAACSDADLLPLVERESHEVGAVILSKLATDKAAALVSQLPGPQARAIAMAMSSTAGVRPDIVEQIGHVLLDQLQDHPQTAFDDPPENRIGAILNLATAQTRDQVLDGMAEADADLAERVRKTILTFPDLPTRLAPRDVPTLTRLADPDDLRLALSGAQQDGMAEAAEFILSNMSQRLAAQLREEMQELGSVRPTDGEAAMTRVIAALRQGEAAGDITLIQPEDGDDEG